MRRMFVAALVVALCAPVPASAQDDVVPLVDLLADPAAYAPPAVAAVTVVGELVGDYGHRGADVWTQLNDDPYARSPLLSGGGLAGSNVGIGVRIPARLFSAAESDSPGGYRHRGPIVRLTGVWRHHDPDRGGESYLDVTALELVEHERPLAEGVRPLVLLGGIALGVLGTAVWADDRRRRRFR